MILEEFDKDKYERTIREDGFEDGLVEGIERTIRLYQILTDQNRLGDLARFNRDPEYRETLFQEFDI